jgi:hypothetical protein
MLWFFKYFRWKIRRKKRRFWLKTKLNYAKNLLITLVFEINANFFRRKLSKIAENCDRNIDPWNALICAYYIFDVHSSKKFQLFISFCFARQILRTIFCPLVHFMGIFFCEKGPRILQQKKLANQQKNHKNSICVNAFSRKRKATSRRLVFSPEIVIKCKKQMKTC